jgi:murein DD-endopeptidase MepM/ murein hydrolase activator NlpD
MRRILAIALLCAALQAIFLGSGASAQVTSEGTPTATPTAETVVPPLSADPGAGLGTTTDPLEPPPPAPSPPAPTTPRENTPAQPSPAPVPPAAADKPPSGRPPADAEADSCEMRARVDSALAKLRRSSSSTSTRDCAPESVGGSPEGSKPKTPERASRKSGETHSEEEAPAAGRVRLRRADGTPSVKHPSYASATLGAAPIGVRNFFIDKLRVPPFLLPIYQAAGMEYGIRWEVLAAINEIETDYGRNLNISSAGALGWMQFMPATWRAYGVDANRDGAKDPYNPVDAIFAAARYLRASGGDTDLRRAIFAYNHADWYVDSVLMRARLLSGLPPALVGSLTGLTQARFPVYAKATYAGELESRRRRTARGGNAALPVDSEATRRDIEIFARRGAPVIAVNDGRIVGMGRSPRLGRWIRLRDVYGNTFTYADLGQVSESYPALRQRRVTRTAIARELELPRPGARPRQPASTTRRAASQRRTPQSPPARPSSDAAAAQRPGKERLFAHPARPNVKRAQRGAAEPDFTPIAGLARFDARDYESRPLRKGARVVAGTVLGRLAAPRTGRAPRLRFEIRPAGRGAPRIDPKPILDGWKLLETTAIYRAAGRNPFFGRDAEQPTIGQILLMSKDALMRRVVRNPRIEIYDCGERDVISGQIDRRVLASLEYLAASGLRPTVSSLKCGHGFYTASGNVSHHSSGNAVDIAAVNGIPILGNQGRGSVTEITIQRLLALQGAMKPDQIISLMTFEATDNTYAMGDHDDHIHVGWRPLYATDRRAARGAGAVLKPHQWLDLVEQLGGIRNPEVSAVPSRYAVKVVRRASRAHRGE